MRTILKLAGLTPNEERIFLEAYVEAHPERAAEFFAQSHRALSIAMPNLGDASAQHRLEALIRRLAEDVIETFVDESRVRRAGRAA